MVKWENVELGEEADIYRGGSPRPIQKYITYRNDGINWIKIGDVAPNAKYINATEERIIPEGANYSRPVNKGDFVLSNSMSFGRPYILKIDGCIHDGWLTIQNYQKNFDTDFLYYVLSSENTFQQYASMAAGSSVQNLNKEKVSKVVICKPPLPEQHHIATVLSDTDNLIAALEKLIAKKRAIKQGAMQELLTGKRRLPGFRGEWVENKLGELCKDKLRKGQLITEKQIRKGTIPVVAGGKEAAYYHDQYNRLENIITISASGANAGFVNFWICKIFASDCTTIEQSNKYNVKFVYYSLLNQQKIIYMLQIGGAQPHVQPPQLQTLEIKTPPTIAEQTAIASILSNMDKEIDTLTAKLNKYKHIKQGMMSELLTGRIRLTEQKTNSHNQQFDDAVMIAGIVNVLYSDEYPLGRKKVQKCLYLLRRHQAESTAAFKKKAAGPYADEIRYKGGEPIALKNGYIKAQKGDKGTKFAIGEKANQALGYIENWGKQGDIQWVADKLRYKNVNDLELLATVDMAICDLTEAGIPVSIDAIKHLIATNVEWKAKLKKQTFSDNNIANAIKELQILLPGEL